MDPKIATFGQVDIRDLATFGVEKVVFWTFSKLRMLAKKKMLIFCLLESGGERGGGQIKIVFKNPKMSDFFRKLK